MENKKQRMGGRFAFFFILLVLGGAYCYRAATIPLPDIQPSVAEYSLSVKTPAADLSWPTASESAASVVGLNDIETHGDQKPLPTASVAKVITALVVLQSKPLRKGEQGPFILITDKDVARYTDYVEKDGSVTPVNAGEKISEYQMLQAILLPSANNIADTLAVWAYGSLNNYHTAADAWLKKNGMNDTTVGVDASGYSPTTKSTAKDLVKLGKLAMANPVVAEIVAMPEAKFGSAGIIFNVNNLLGKDGLVGIKTGNTEQAGGVFLGASIANIDGQKNTVVTAIMGADTRDSALTQTLPLSRSAQANFKPVAVIKDGAVVGEYYQPWSGESVQARAAGTLTVTAWKGSTLPAHVTLSPISLDAKNGQQVGSLSAGPTSKRTPVTLSGNFSKPPIWWRILHPNVDALF